MKRMKKLSVLALFLMTVLLLSGCFGGSGIVSGTVTDSVSELPISEVAVVIGGTSVSTGENGTYSVQLKPGEHSVQVTKAGYETYEGVVTVVKDEETTLNVQLVMLPATVSGTVIDGATSEPIVAATVTVGTESTTTSDNGSYSLQVDAGEHNLTITKVGYEAYTDTVTAVADEVTIADAQLTAMITSTVTGIVTDGRGGPVVEGVTIRVEGFAGYTTTTDANGEFNLVVPANTSVELLVEAENRATMRVQAIELAENEEISLEIPTRDIFNPNWSAVPPTISLNILPGQELTGNQEITVTVDGERDTYLIYAYLGGDHRNPRTAFKVDSNDATVTVDTTAFPNGESFLKVLVYDDNENGALYVVPVTINNVADDIVVPADMTNLKIISMTHGQNIGFYSINKMNQRLEEQNLDYDVENIINAAPAGASLNNSVIWAPVEGADGYKIYRAFGTVDAEGIITYGDYTLFSTVPATATSIDDFSSQIVAGQPMMYKVVPYNSFGEGASMERSVTPLPAFNVYLEGPADQAADISLNPTFTWSNDVVGGTMPEGVAFYSELSIYESTSSMVWYDDSIENVQTYELTGTTLDPNSVYSWDISYSEAFALYSYDDTGFSYASSVAGEYGGTGSINGEFIFSTITNVQ